MPQGSFRYTEIETDMSNLRKSKATLGLEEKGYYKGMLEALIFLAPEPPSLGALSQACNLDKALARELIGELMADYEERNLGIFLHEEASLYVFKSASRYASVAREFLNLDTEQEKKTKLSRASLEVLAIICYKQPITLTEIEAIRCANSRSLLLKLLQKDLVKIQGKKPVPGKPSLYSTTDAFLRYFGLSSYQELPKLKEIKELALDPIAVDR